MNWHFFFFDPLLKLWTFFLADAVLSIVPAAFGLAYIRKYLRDKDGSALRKSLALIFLPTILLAFVCQLLYTAYYTPPVQWLDTYAEMAQNFLLDEWFEQYSVLLFSGICGILSFSLGAISISRFLKSRKTGYLFKGLLLCFAVPLLFFLLVWGDVAWADYRCRMLHPTIY